MFQCHNGYNKPSTSFTIYLSIFTTFIPNFCSTIFYVSHLITMSADLNATLNHNGKAYLRFFLFARNLKYIWNVLFTKKKDCMCGRGIVELKRT